MHMRVKSLAVFDLVDGSNLLAIEGINPDGVAYVTPDHRKSFGLTLPPVATRIFSMVDQSGRTSPAQIRETVEVLRSIFLLKLVMLM